jgi:hypothetical protein
MSVLLLALLAGACGGGTGNVSGKVTFGGRRVPTGTITFFHGTNKTTSSPINPDGTYAVSNIRTGTAKVAIAMPMAIDFVGPTGGRTSLAPALPANQVPSIPPRYFDPEKSGLSWKVSRGEQTFDIDLKP